MGGGAAVGHGLLPHCRRHLRERGGAAGEDPGAAVALLYVVQRGQGISLGKLKLYRMTEFVGRWSMIDVFVVAILAGLIRRDNLMTIYPGLRPSPLPGSYLVTMVAAMSFDSRLI